MEIALISTGVLNLAVVVALLLVFREFRASKERPLAAVVNAPEPSRPEPKLSEAQLNEWVLAGYNLAETSSTRSQKENSTKPTSTDKRDCAIAWCVTQAKSAGIVWTDALAQHSARLIEIHHAALHAADPIPMTPRIAVPKVKNVS